MSKKKMDLENILKEIIDGLNNNDTSESSIIDIMKEITYHKEKEKIIIEIIKYIWTLKSIVSDYFIYGLINSSYHMELVSSRNILNQIKKLIGQDKLCQVKLLEIIPILVSNIQCFEDTFTGFIDINEINCYHENVVPLIKVMREMNTLTKSEKSLLIKRLLDLLGSVDLFQCPELVHETLLLCDKINFQYCIGSVINFFNNKSVSSSQLSQSTMNSDNKRMMDIQLAVLNYCNNIAKCDSEFIKEILKFCKNNNPVFSISGFMCILLLNLSGLENTKGQILDFLRSCITSCFKDNKLILESAFVRESVNEHFDMDALLLNAVKYGCASNRNKISASLVQLGFLLIKSGTPKSKIVSMKSQSKSKKDILLSETCNNDFNMTTLQTVGQAGVQIIIHLFKKLSQYRQQILDSILRFILTNSYRPSVFVYLELLADLVSIMPLEIHPTIEGQYSESLFEMLCHFPHEVALAVVHALLPLIRYSSIIRKRLLHIVVRNMLSEQRHTRLICVESALILMKYLRVSTTTTTTTTIREPNDSEDDDDENLNLLTQSSQFASTQIASECCPLRVDNSVNEDICRSILSVVDMTCLRYDDTKPIVYRGLVQVIERNFHFAVQLVLFLVTKLEAIVSPASNVDDDASSSNPFLVHKIFQNDLETVRITEPVGTLVSCLAESISLCRRNMPASDILAVASDEDDSMNVCILETLNRAESLLHDLLKRLSLRNIEEMGLYKKDEVSATSTFLLEQFLDVYEVLLAYFVCSDDGHKDMVRRLFENREHAARLQKTAESRARKYESISSVISLPTLVGCLENLLEPLQTEVRTSHYHRPSQMMPPPASTVPPPSQRSQAPRSSTTQAPLEQSSLTLFLNEKVSMYLLNRAISLVKRLGGPDFRITSRNREQVCGTLSDFVNVSLDYYLVCLCADKTEALTTPQRQLMQNCALLYSDTLKKVIQFFSKTTHIFLANIRGAKDHLKAIQRKVGLTQGPENGGDEGNISMSMFVRINKAIVTRILVLGEKRLYPDVDGLLNSALNVAIFCGLDDVRQQHTVTYGCNRMNTTLLSSLNKWLSDLLRTSRLTRSLLQGGQESTHGLVEVHDAAICRVIASMTLVISRMVTPDSICFTEKLTKFINGKMGSYSSVSSEPFKSGFLLLNNPKDILADVMNALSTSLDDTDWLLTKWKTGWMEIKQRKAINNSQLSNLGSTPSELIENSLTIVIDQDRFLVEQLRRLCMAIKWLVESNINSVLRLQELVKISTRYFDQLIILTKQYIALTKSKLSSCSSAFKNLVFTTGELSAQISLFIIYIQKVESVSRAPHKEKVNDADESDVLFESQNKNKKKKKDSDNMINQIGRTDKEIKLIPSLVFSLEQYQRYLIELQRLSKIDLMKYVKVINNRDFRIDLSKLQQSLLDNVSVDMSESDDDEDLLEDEQVPLVMDLDEVENIVEQHTADTNEGKSPPKKKLRT